MGFSIAWPTVDPLGATVPRTIPGAAYNRAQYPGGHSEHGHNTHRLEAARPDLGRPMHRGGLDLPTVSGKVDNFA